MLGAVGDACSSSGKLGNKRGKLARLGDEEWATEPPDSDQWATALTWTNRFKRQDYEDGFLEKYRCSKLRLRCSGAIGLLAQSSDIFLSSLTLDFTWVFLFKFVRWVLYLLLCVCPVHQRFQVRFALLVTVLLVASLGVQDILFGTLILSKKILVPWVLLVPLLAVTKTRVTFPCMLLCCFIGFITRVVNTDVFELSFWFQSFVQCFWASAVSGGASIFVERVLARQFILDKRLESKEFRLKERREITDKVLLKVFPFSIATRVRSESQSSLRSLVNATIMFVNIQINCPDVGEDMLCYLDRLQQRQSLIDDLNTRFSRVEMIKTDSSKTLYLGGISANSKGKGDCTDLQEALQMALLFQKANRNTCSCKLHGSKCVSLKIAIHFGSVVVGIIRSLNVTFDMWGENINNCSHFLNFVMENQIIISQDVVDMLPAGLFRTRQVVGLTLRKPVRTINLYSLIDMSDSLWNTQRQEYVPSFSPDPQVPVLPIGKWTLRFTDEEEESRFLDKKYRSPRLWKYSIPLLATYHYLFWLLSKSTSTYLHDFYEWMIFLLGHIPLALLYFVLPLSKRVQTFRGVMLGLLSVLQLLMIIQAPVIEYVFYLAMATSAIGVCLLNLGFLVSLFVCCFVLLFMVAFLLINPYLSVSFLMQEALMFLFVELSSVLISYLCEKTLRLSYQCLARISRAMKQIKIEVKMRREYLRTIIPDHIIDLLGQSEQIPNVLFQEEEIVGIIALNIVNSTAIGHEIGEMALVNLYESVFSTCDSSVVGKEYRCYKVKTIGDIVVYACGLNRLESFSSAFASSLEVAKILVRTVQEFNSSMPRDRNPLQVRVGISAGPICAGIISKSRPRYDVFGDPVEKAIKLGQQGYPFNINIDPIAWKYLSPKTQNEMPLPEAKQERLVLPPESFLFRRRGKKTVSGLPSGSDPSSDTTEDASRSYCEPLPSMFVNSAPIAPIAPLVSYLLISPPLNGQDYSVMSTSTELAASDPELTSCRGSKSMAEPSASYSGPSSFDYNENSLVKPWLDKHLHPESRFVSESESGSTNKLSYVDEQLDLGFSAQDGESGAGTNSSSFHDEHSQLADAEDLCSQTLSSPTAYPASKYSEYDDEQIPTLALGSETEWDESLDDVDTITVEAPL